MKPWLLLAAAIVAEVTGTLALRASDGFSKPWPSALVAAGYVTAFVLMARILKSLPVGTVYAVWAATGIALVAVASRVIFGDQLPLMAAVGIVIILIGVVTVSLSGASIGGH